MFFSFNTESNILYNDPTLATLYLSLAFMPRPVSNNFDLIWKKKKLRNTLVSFWLSKAVNSCLNCFDNYVFLVMNSITLDPSDPGRISLAYRDLEKLPEGWLSKLNNVTVLDLSHNNLSYPFSSANWMLAVYHLQYDINIIFICVVT